MTREQCASLKPGDKVYVTKGCPDGNPYRGTVRDAWSGAASCEGVHGIHIIGAGSLHLTASEALAHFENLRTAAIEEVEKQIRTLPDRLNKLRRRKPVIEE